MKQQSRIDTLQNKLGKLMDDLDQQPKSMQDMRTIKEDMQDLMGELSDIKDCFKS